MENCNTVVEIVKATAWPIATLFAALWFSKDISTLSIRLKKWRVGDAELEFQETVNALANDMPEIASASNTTQLKPEVAQLVNHNPRVAVQAAGAEIYTALTDLARKNNLTSEPTRLSYSALVWALADAGLIPKSYALGCLALLQLYNQTTRQIDFKPTKKSVLSYLAVAEKLKQILREAEQA